MDDLIIKASKQTKDGQPYLSFPKVEYIKWLKEFEDGHELLILLQDKRSLSMNKCLHGWIKILAESIGNDFDTMKYWVVIKNFGYTIQLIDDEEFKVPVSTSKLKKEDFSIGLIKTHAWALEKFNIDLPSNKYLN